MDLHLFHMSTIILLIAIVFSPSTASNDATSISTRTLQAEVKEFLEMYDKMLQRLYTVSSEAHWKSSTDVSDENTGRRIGADEAFAAFVGNVYVIERTKHFLNHSRELDDLTVRQLREILLSASSYPGTIPDIVTARVTAEARQSAVLDGYTFCYEYAGDSCAKAISPNQIDDLLRTSTDLRERKHVWEVSKQIGRALRPGLIDLQRLRNRVAHEMGFTSFYDMRVASYGMRMHEMKSLAQNLLTEMMPLYEQLHCWTKHKLAERYNQPVPKRIPAHWIGNRWAQAWPGLVEGIDLNPLFAEKSPEWIIEQAERFYVSLGWPALPKSFWEKSDLYELPPEATRKKNTHASAWHIDLDQDVRSLMSIKPDFNWFETAHHELGHVYYFLAYANPDVPLTLRDGANGAFHEAIGDLISIAARQVPYLKEIGVMPADMEIDLTRWLLDEALDNAVVFIPWSAGVMMMWEHDLYEGNLSPDEYNARWWYYVGKNQGIDPPTARGEEFCDAATKTHINDAPAYYHHYVLAYMIKYQLHMHIARNILKQDPHNCNYYGNEEVGKFLWDILRLGKTKDWRVIIKEATGEELSARAMLEYFQPVMEFLRKENLGREVKW